MAPIVRWWLTGIAFVFVATTGHFGVWAPADTKLQELRFAATDRAPSGEFVFVDIDSASLMHVGVWPWPRSVHAQVLDRLMALGAYEVAFDIDFSAASSPAQDMAFARSLEQAGGYAYLAAFRQVTAKGEEVLNTPLPAFANHAQPVLVNVDALEGGLVRGVPSALGETGLESIASTFSPDAPVSGSIRIDYGIDLAEVPRIPVMDLLNGTVDPALIRDRQVVVGASAIELHDLFATPRFGIVPGPLVQIAAAETLRLGRPLTSLGIWPAIILAGLLLLASTTFRAAKIGVALAGTGAVLVAVEVFALSMLAFRALEAATLPVHVAAATALLIRLLDERAIRRRQIQEQNARLAYMATHDLRTGALSHAGWLEALDDELRRKGGHHSILLVQLERLDTTGASLGFEVSEAATALVYARLSTTDIGSVGRVETDIFALALKTAASDAEIGLLMDLLKRPYEFGGHRVFVDIRWGMSDVSSGSGAALGLQHARMALAVATRNKLPGLRYADTLDAELEYRRSIDLTLREALSKGEFDLVFQQQVDMKTRQVTGVEALVRWTSSEHGVVSPASFIPLAEENGTIIQIGTWIAHEACRRAIRSGWKGRLSINVSPVQFQQSDVVAMLESAVRKSGFPPDRLDIEITESLLIDGKGAIIQSLQRLRTMGMSIAIDDFGTGYSSLSYLSDLPVDKLKIDQSFVRNLSTARGSGVIQAIVSLGQSLDLTLVVEGVETQEQFTYLANLGCNVAQGYLFGKPASLATLTLQKKVA